MKAEVYCTGAYVMDRQMFDEGEAGWPASAPFRAPVFVVTHRPRGSPQVAHLRYRVK